MASASILSPISSVRVYRLLRRVLCPELVPSRPHKPNGTLFFSADDWNGTELWKSDGTEAGTVAGDPDAHSIRVTQ